MTLKLNGRVAIVVNKASLMTCKALTQWTSVDGRRLARP